MAIKKIILNGAPVLREKSRKVTEEELKSEKIQSLIKDMVETMKSAKGVGLAAPQVGVSLRIFIAESPSGPIALINPEISGKSWGKTTDEEGCLSIPGVFDMVKRHKKITVRALNIYGEQVSFKAEGFFARIIQHENDHLDGILFIDRVTK